MEPSNGHYPLTVVTAYKLAKHGARTVPIDYGKKTVTRHAWINERWEESDFDRLYGQKPTNIGVLLGEASLGLVDCDLDTQEAIAVGAAFLPSTGMRWGRESKPSSHFAYRVTPSVGGKNIPYKDPLIKKTDADSGRRAMLCELRIKGQTVAPGSLHPSGEIIRWEEDGDGDPAAIDYVALQEAMGRVAASALLARYWSEGVRHDMTLPLAGVLCRGGMEENQAIHFVRVTCRAAGEDEDTIEHDRVHAVRDTYAKAAAGQWYTGAPTLEEFLDPKIVAKLREWLGLSRQAYTGDIGPDGWPLSDIGNAERFAAKWKGSVLYCDDEDAWYMWTGIKWLRDRENVIYRRSIEIVNEFRTLANDPNTVSKGNTTVDQWRKHSDKMSQLRQVKAMQEIAKALLPILPEDFDADPHLINCPNGTLELNFNNGTWYFREARADDYLTMTTGAAFVEGATNPHVNEHRQLFFPEMARWEFLLNHMGNALTGLPKRDALMLIGPTNSGKSLTLEIMVRTLGDYAATLSYDSLMEDRNGTAGRPRPDLWRVRNKRLVTVTEVPPDKSFNVPLFKTLLSGGDKTNVRTYYDRTGGQDIMFRFALWTSGNKPYGPPPGEEAAYERLHVLECLHQIKREERDDRKQQQVLDMAETGSAWLWQMVLGFQSLYGEKRGVIIAPDFVQRSTRQLQDTLDPWTDIIDRFFVIDGDHGNSRITQKDVWFSYVQPYRVETLGLSKANKNIMAAKNDFKQALERRGVKEGQLTTVFDKQLFWSGIRLKTENNGP